MRERPRKLKYALNAESDETADCMVMLLDIYDINQTLITVCCLLHLRESVNEKSVSEPCRELLRIVPRACKS